MNYEVLLPYIVSICSATLSGVGAFAMSNKKAKENIKRMQEQNKLDIEKLMNQHKLDLKALEKKHEMELESKEKDHIHKMEITQKDHENMMVRKEKEIEDTAKYGAMKDLISDAFGGIMKDALNNDEVKKGMTNIFAESFKK